MSVENSYQPSILINKIELPKGCCGMAGAFGYENYELSKKIAHNSIISGLKKYNNKADVIATGVSCHHQIEDLLAIESKHTAEILLNHLRL